MCIQNSYVTNIKLCLAEHVFRSNNVVRTFQVCYPSALNRIPMNVMYAMLTTFTCNVGVVSNKKRKIAGPGRGKDGLGNKKEKIIVDEESAANNEQVAEKVTASKCIELIKLADSGQRRNFINNLVDELSAEEKSLLSSELGKSIADDVKKEALYLKGFYHNIDNLIDYDIKEFVASRNPILCEFIEGATKTSHFENQNRSYHLAKVIESVYKLANPTVVYPLAFINNLYIYITQRCRFDRSSYRGWSI